MPRSGLCNRLRVLTSSEVLAKLTGRSLRVCWEQGVGFSDEDFNDLFENQFPRVGADEFSLLREQGLRLDEVVRPSGGNQARPPAESGFDQVFDLEGVPVVTYSHFLGLHQNPPPSRRLPSEFVTMCRQQVRTLQPEPSIRLTVEELAGSFGPMTVGVHVRRGDAIRYPHIGEHYRRSTDRSFFALMDDLMKRQPNTTFFLATDSADTEARFRERYGEALLTNPAKRFVESEVGRSKENQRDAVIDLYTLASTRRVLGTNWSSFSETAAIVGGIPLQVAYSRQSPMRKIGRRARGKAILIARRAGRKAILVARRSGRGTPQGR